MTLGIALAASLGNALYIEPLATKLMFQRWVFFMRLCVMGVEQAPCCRYGLGLELGSSLESCPAASP